MVDKHFDGLSLGNQNQSVDGVVGGSGTFIPLGVVRPPDSTYSTSSTSWTQVTGNFDDEVQFPNVVKSSTIGPDQLGNTENDNVYTVHSAQLSNDTSNETTFIRWKEDTRGETTEELSVTDTSFSSIQSDAKTVQFPFDNPSSWRLEMKVSGGTGEVINTPCLLLLWRVE